MACMCGDTHCHSCGPAQGNFQCPICRNWADDGCEHLGEDGQILPAFQAQVDQIEADQRAADDAYAKDLAEEADLAEQYRSEIRRGYKPNEDEVVES